ncbi:efflux transporter outer membrane subunit [Niabella ginsengisoli]|uniref:TolC family protein n=1 Tax=Niabella ginsengisoli TaxID=522298 RepID=A0ABS9SRH3_9BACT|nr:hypothetical protein [Niabella ginsengisoli]MCH5600846.1 hypothetical protein [Niabella ginsengisoli]
MMRKNKFSIILAMACLSLGYTGCKVPELVSRTENKSTPSAYNNNTDSTNATSIKWRDLFSDPYLASLIDTALKNNQELNIVLQEIEMSRNDIRIRKGEYLPL